tara:strand:+ start:20 stop:196 length:177 start_codon:yes stop_codon:yes gene_type:complete
LSIDIHLNELKRKHLSLSEKIKNEQNSLSTCNLKISELKKMKLSLKEKITRIKKKILI